MSGSSFSKAYEEITFTVKNADLDKLNEVLKDINVRECPWFEVQDKHGNKAKYYREPHWISCSERLPEDNDYRECMECLDGAVWYFTENGAMGLGYYYKSTKEWATIDDLKTDGKVIAWMPLPAPYKSESEG